MGRMRAGTIAFEPVVCRKQAAEVASLAGSIWPEHYRPIVGAAQVRYMLEKFQSEGAVLEQIAEGMKYYLIRPAQGKPIGYLAVHKQKNSLFLSKFYLVSKERGKGIGRKAMEFVEAFARKERLKKIALTVNKKNLMAIGAYQKMGFSVVQAVVGDIGGGFVMDDFRMEKTVTHA